jgi:translation elongation factor EF-1alpha
MSKSINQCIKVVKDKEETMNHGEKDDSVGVKHNWSSTFVKHSNVIVKGEQDNPKSSERKAVISVYDAGSSKLKGNKCVLC